MLKEKLTPPPSWAFSNSTGQLTVDPNASDGQHGCALLQEQEYKQLKPMYYWSRSPGSVERSNEMTY